MTAADELFQVADAAAASLAQIRDQSLQNPLTAIRKVADDAKRAWSGSNIGYHANVYFAGLQPAPPDAQFSAEWGLIAAWPTHEPHSGWCIMDHQVVIDALLERAGVGAADTEMIERALESPSTIFSELKERAISLLTTATDDAPDTYLARKLAQIEKLILAKPSTIEHSLIPAGQFFTRDSRAMSQGLRSAPHQSLIALGLSATVLENGLAAIESTSREAASHLQRLASRTKKASTVGTNVFIGHGRASAWRELKEFLTDRLHLPVDEFNSVPVAGITTPARLSEMLDAAAFAFLIMTAEDEQASGEVRARENVVHEIGLFQGRLGFSRAIVLLEEGCQQFSNIHGLGQIHFPKGKISAAFENVRAVLEREELI